MDAREEFLDNVMASIHEKDPDSTVSRAWVGLLFDVGCKIMIKTAIQDAIEKMGPKIVISGLIENLIRSKEKEIA